MDEAIEEGDFKTVKALIQQGEVEQKDYLGQTPLISASKHGKIEIVEYLIYKGALINAHDRT